MSARKRSDALTSALEESTLQLLFRTARLLDERARDRVNRVAGKAVLRPSHTRLLPFLTREGVRPTALARRLELSKQAIGKAFEELIAAGVAEKVPDPQDGRAFLVRLTRRGEQSMLHGLGVLEELEQELRDHVGAESMDALRETLKAVLHVAERAETPGDLERP